MYVLKSWTALVNQYPSYLTMTTDAVKAMIGGGINSPDIKNACAIRMSRTLNYNSIPIPRDISWLKTRKGVDKKNYALRVVEMRKWFGAAIGKPAFEITKKEGVAFDKKTLSAFKGIIAFDIHFSDATGHFDLWDGSQFTHEPLITDDYWTKATKISLWKPLSYL